MNEAGRQYVGKGRERQNNLPIPRMRGHGRKVGNGNYSAAGRRLRPPERADAAGAQANASRELSAQPTVRP